MLCIKDTLVNMFDLLPNEIIQEIAKNLNYKSLLLLSQVSYLFSTLANNTHLLTRTIRNNGYYGNITGLSEIQLRFLGPLIGSRFRLHGKIYTMGESRSVALHGDYKRFGAPNPNNNTTFEVSGFDNIIQVSLDNEGNYLALTNAGQVYYVKYYKDHSEVARPKLELFSKFDNIIQISRGDYLDLLLHHTGKVRLNQKVFWGATCQKICDQETISIVEDVIQVSCGTYHNLCLRADGRVYSFGYNHSGKLGLCHTRVIEEVWVIPTLEDIIEISAGSNHSLCLDKDGKVYSFGYNKDGQLGLGHRKSKCTKAY